jgi:hypothetical protein
VSVPEKSGVVLATAPCVCSASRAGCFFGGEKCGAGGVGAALAWTGVEAFPGTGSVPRGVDVCWAGVWAACGAPAVVAAVAPEMQSAAERTSAHEVRMRRLAGSALAIRGVVRETGMLLHWCDMGTVLPGTTERIS